KRHRRSLLNTCMRKMVSYAKIKLNFNIISSNPFFLISFLFRTYEQKIWQCKALENRSSGTKKAFSALFKDASVDALLLFS
ncbi:MAG: hypothetical protein J5846_10720, partial [Desulfovibrio sp.]|nr:hypothetical protein [Desulfovibrio sp.]